MRRLPLIALLATTLLAAPAAVPAAVRAPASAPASPPPADPAPAPLAELVRAVSIPYERFTLTNGLTVIVHTDRKAPIVGVTTYYRVGSKHEPRGRTGFAHLFEHLMFGGSENVANYDIPLEAAGSSPSNGSTWYDRTNYVETVPTGALEVALFEESDRMGHLLGAVSQDKLDKQRGVVENEKRQNDAEPGGLEDYLIGDGLFAVGHPYRHATIGSMADLEAATLDDVRGWFRDHYAPNNAVLVLSGDIDAATARPLVEKWYGAIPAGAPVRAVAAAPVALKASVHREVSDAVPNLRLTRNWSGPGLNAPDALALAVGMDVLGGLSSSRLDNALVRGAELATSVSAAVQQHEQVGIVQVAMEVKDGVARARAEAALDAAIARFRAEGPSADELRRAVTRRVSGEIARLEAVGDFGGKGATLAEGQLYSGDPAHYHAVLAQLAALTPATVRNAVNRWLSRPVLAIATAPGTRTLAGETLGGWDDGAVLAPPAAAPARAPLAAAAPLSAAAPRAAPLPLPVADLVLPPIARFTLGNGIPVALVERHGVPIVRLSIQFDAGIAADALDTPGTQGLMLALLTEGTARHTATQLAEAQERLGAQIAPQEGLDSSAVALSVPSPNFAAALALTAEVVRSAAYRPDDVARLRAQQLAALAQAEASPRDLAPRRLAPLLFGAGHPYGQPGDGLGNAESLRALTPDRLRAARDTWLRPDLARITVVGDTTPAALRPLLEAALGGWRPPAGPPPHKDVAAPPLPARPRIVLIDHPGSPQSMIVAGRVLPLSGRDPGQEPLDLANEVLGNDFLSRLNSDLREDKGWSYGVHTGISTPVGARTFTLSAPVQADRTGDAIRAILSDIAAYPAQKPTLPGERARVTEGNIRALPRGFETGAALLGAVVQNDRLRRGDTYYATLATRLRAIDAAALDAAARRWLGADGLTFVVVGPRATVEPQLAGIGLPVEVAGG